MDLEIEGRGAFVVGATGDIGRAIGCRRVFPVARGLLVAAGRFGARSDRGRLSKRIQTDGAGLTAILIKVVRP